MRHIVADSLQLSIREHMSRYSSKKKVSPETRDEAMKIAKGTQRPGQTKEQTRLIAQGIQKGIDQYKKQQKAKARELDKKLKSTQQASSGDHIEIQQQVVYRQHWLPWLLLGVSWVAAAVYFFS
jgi:hypothetical protein